MVKDPVCKMSVDEKSAHKSTYAGQNHVFCSSDCKTMFDNEPGKFVAPAAKEVEKVKKT